MAYVQQQQNRLLTSCHDKMDACHRAAPGTTTIPIYNELSIPFCMPRPTYRGKNGRKPAQHRCANWAARPRGAMKTVAVGSGNYSFQTQLRHTTSVGSRPFEKPSPSVSIRSENNQTPPPITAINFKPA